MQLAMSVLTVAMVVCLVSRLSVCLSVSLCLSLSVCLMSVYTAETEFDVSFYSDLAYATIAVFVIISTCW